MFMKATTKAKQNKIKIKKTRTHPRSQKILVSLVNFFYAVLLLLLLALSATVRALEFVVVIVYCVVVHWVKTSFFCHYIRTCFSSQVITLVVVLFCMFFLLLWFLLLVLFIPRNNKKNIWQHFYHSIIIHCMFFYALPYEYCVCFYAVWMGKVVFHVNSFLLYTYTNKYFLYSMLHTICMLNIKEQKKTDKYTKHHPSLL